MQNRQKKAIFWQKQRVLDPKMGKKCGFLLLISQQE